MNLFAIGRGYECDPKITAIPGHWCQSAFERSVFWLFKQAEAAGTVAEVTLHPRAVELGAAKHRYHVDIRFSDVDGGRGVCYVEAKGMVHASWHRNLKDWEQHGPAPLLIFKGSPEWVVLNRIVFPKHGGSSE